MIIITGASRGIGKFLFNKFFEKKMDVVGTYLNTEPIENKEFFSRLDITNEESVQSFFSVNNDRLKNLVLINCAGINSNGLVTKFELTNWKQVIETNLTGSFLMTKHILPIMRKQNYGRIINISSVTAQRGSVGTAAYSSSKAALWGFTKVVAIENASKGITANCLNLGYFDVGMISEVPVQILDQIIATIPQKKLGNPMNILNAINFLIESDYITGTGIDLSGGLI